MAFRSIQMSPPAIPENTLSTSTFPPATTDSEGGKSISAPQLSGEACRDSFHWPPQWAQIPQPQPHRPHCTDSVCPAWLIDWRKQSHMFLLVQEAKMGSCFMLQGMPVPPIHQGKDQSHLGLPQASPHGDFTTPLALTSQHLILPPLPAVPPSLASPPLPFT